MKRIHAVGCMDLLLDIDSIDTSWCSSFSQLSTVGMPLNLSIGWWHKELLSWAICGTHVVLLIVWSLLRLLWIALWLLSVCHQQVPFTRYRNAQVWVFIGSGSVHTCLQCFNASSVWSPSSCTSPTYLCDQIETQSCCTLVEAQSLGSAIENITHFEVDIRVEWGHSRLTDASTGWWAILNIRLVLL